MKVYFKWNHSDITKRGFLFMISTKLLWPQRPKKALNSMSYSFVLSHFHNQIKKIPLIIYLYLFIQFTIPQWYVIKFNVKLKISDDSLFYFVCFYLLFFFFHSPILIVKDNKSWHKKGNIPKIKYFFPLF